MKEKLLIIGAGGHARSVLDVAIAQGAYNIVGCISQHKGEDVGINGIQTVGTDSDLKFFLNSGINNVFIAVGDNRLRNKLFEEIADIGFSFVNLISPNAYISPLAKLGVGICIMHGAIVNVNTKIDDNTIINTNASLDHDCKIGKSCHIAPGVTLSGSVVIGDKTHIGTGANIVDGIYVGSDSYIGSGSLVIRDISSNKMAYGVPAKVIRDYM